MLTPNKNWFSNRLFLCGKKTKPLLPSQKKSFVETFVQKKDINRISFNLFFNCYIELGIFSHQMIRKLYLDNSNGLNFPLSRSFWKIESRSKFFLEKCKFILKILRCSITFERQATPWNVGKRLKRMSIPSQGEVVEEKDWIYFVKQR